jgi:hypothetical protein
MPRPLNRKLKRDEFYCVSCRKACKGENIRKAKARVTGQPMLKGYCSKCDCKVNKFVKA